MVQINQHEAKYLRDKKFGRLIHISSATHKSAAKRYYLTEEPRALRVLNDYRKRIVVTEE